MGGALLRSVLLSGFVLAGGASDVWSADLSSLIGIWAHSREDCDRYSRGEFDAVSRAEASASEVIVICPTAIEWRYTAASCDATNVAKTTDEVQFQATCEFKGEPADRRMQVIVKLRGDGSISFADKKFWAFGDYVRCSKNFKCVRGD